MFRYVHTLAVFIFLCVVGLTAYGQDAQVQGQVLDSSGAGIQKALVRVVDQKSGTERKTQTNDNGQYTASGLAAGTYQIYVQASGFSAAVSDQITLNPRQSMVLDFTLKVGPNSTDVIVTAEKKAERLMDVPVPLTVLDPAPLAQNNLDNIQDYFATIPGVQLSSTASGSSTQFITIRGLATSTFANPVVSMLIDDVPVGSSQQIGFGGVLFPNVDPSDLSRIEVLRGPQGTLYGADSLGGVIKIVTKDPSLDKVSGGATLSGEEVQGGDLGYAARMNLNLPLSNIFGIRGSGFGREDPGYIKNITTDEHNINKDTAFGGRLSLLWLLSDKASLQFSGLAQQVHGGSDSIVLADTMFRPAYGLTQAGIRGNWSYKSELQVYSAHFNEEIRHLKLTSVTGYGVTKVNDPIQDWTAVYGASSEQYFGVPGAYISNDLQNNKFSQEVRLSSSAGERIEWLAGGFYTHERSPAIEYVRAVTTPDTQVVGTLIKWDYQSRFQEYSVFGDATIHFPKQFDLQLGGREARNNQVFNETDSGLLVPTFDINPTTGVGYPSPYVQPTEHASGNAFTWLATPSYKPSSNLMIYARLASGYRNGGPNDEAALVHAPVEYKPDTTINYEIGVKTELFDHRLSIDTSAFYIDWRDIQIVLENLQTLGYYVLNGGHAKSEGIELSVDARPTHGLSISGALSLDDAELTEALPPASSVAAGAGTRLPYSSRVSGSAAVEQEVFRSNHWKSAIGATLVSVGPRAGDLAATQQQNTFRAYTALNLHADATYKSWNLDLFANNVGNSRGVTGANQADWSLGGTGQTVTIIRPRTIGVSVAKHF